MGVDRGERRGVQQLEPGHGGAGRDDGRGRAARGLERGERDPLRDDVLRKAVQADLQLGDHGERALGADEQRGQVVSRRGLGRAAAGADHAPVGQHRLEGEDVGAHLPVADRGRPGGVRRRHPTEGRVRAGVDGEEEAVLAGRAREGAAGDSGLHGRGQIGGRELEDPVEPREVEADPGVRGDHVALQARAGAERCHRNAALVGEREDARDLAGRGGVDDEVGPLRPVEADVGRVEVAVRVAGGHAPAVGERRFQLDAQLIGGDAHASDSDSDGRSPATRSTAQLRLSCTVRSAAAPSCALQAARKAA